MKTKKRQKLCYNCDGEIDIDVIVCPFCAADLREEKPEQRYGSYITHVDSSYRNPHRRSQTEEEANPEEFVEEEDPTFFEEEEEETRKSAVLPTVLFTLGVQLCVLSLLMLLFSHNGVVLLKWNARYWFLYMLVSAPLVFFGYRSLQRR